MKRNIKKEKSKQKTAAEIKELYNIMKKDGVTPEQVMFYLLAHMNKLKASEMGMDLHDPAGRQYSIVVQVVDGTCDSRMEEKTILTKNKSTTPWVI